MQEDILSSILPFIIGFINEHPVMASLLVVAVLVWATSKLCSGAAELIKAWRTP